MYFQFLEDSCRYSQTIWCKIIEMRKIKRRVFIQDVKTITESDRTETNSIKCITFLIFNCKNKRKVLDNKK